MIFSLEVRRARKGDCLLLHYGNATKAKDTHLILIDGGPRGVYTPHLKPRLEALRQARQLADSKTLLVDALMVSHVDDDHIQGILDLTKEQIQARDVGRQSIQILDLWHNSFDAIIDTKPDEATASVKSQFGEASTSGGGEFSDDALGQVETEYADVNDGVAPEEATELVSSTMKVLASIEQGYRLRLDAKNLEIEPNAAFDGELIVANKEPFNMEGDISFTVVGPMKSEIEALRKAHNDWLEKLKEAGKSVPQALAAYVDKSVPNLSSIVMLAEKDGKSILLTGDARGDKVLQGLEFVNRLKKGDKFDVDILKVPHHGSANNLDNDFFERIVAKHYVFSGDGEHGNPERESLEMLVEARGKSGYTIHLTYPIDEIDKGRKEDWLKQQNKEKNKKKTKKSTVVRPDWSPAEHSLRAFIDKQAGLEKNIRIVDATEPHIINLIDAVEF